mgnify:FL=1
MKITITGISRIGLAHAACFAEGGHEVTYFDEDEEKVKLLKSGKLPFYEPDVEEALKNNKSRIHYTTEMREAYKSADFIILALPADINEDGSINMENTYKCVEEAAKQVEKDCIITIKSTVPIGTHEQAEQLMKEQLVHNVRIEFVVNPDFIRLGDMVNDFFHASHIIIGVETEFGEAMMREAYKHLYIPFVIIHKRSAELLKYAANGLMTVQNGFMHELARLCEDSGTNIEDIARGLEQGHKIGKQFIQTNLGYGEVPYIKESQSLYYYSKLHEVDFGTLKAAVKTHEWQKWRLLNKARKYYPDFKGVSIAMVGVSSKPGTGMLELAPAVDYIKALLKEGAIIKVWDPAIDQVKDIFAHTIMYGSSIKETIYDADICFIFTKWQDIQYFDVYDYAEYMKHPIVLDGVNCYSLCDIEEAGIVYESIGRKTINGR